MERIKNGWTTLIALMVICAANSCKTTERTSRTVVKEVRVNDIKRAAVERNRNLNGIWVKRIKGSLWYGNNTYSFRGNYKIKRDSVIIISIMSPVGIEAVRILCKKDSFGFVDRINREYYYGPYNILRRKIGYETSFDFIQSILLNEIAMEDEETKADFLRNNERLEIVDNKIKVTVNELSQKRYGKRTVQYELEFDAAILHLIRNRIQEEINNREIEIVYEYFQEINTIWFPGSITLIIKNFEEEIALRMELDRIIIGTDFNANFTISQKYKRIEW